MCTHQAHFWKKQFLLFFRKFEQHFFSSVVPDGCIYCGVTKFGSQSCFKSQRTFFSKFWYHMTFSLFLSKFWKSRNFGNFGHFSTNFACGAHFQEVIKRKLEVFQTNVVNFPEKTRILTGSIKKCAPKRICTQMAHPVPNGPKNGGFSPIFFKRVHIRASACKTPRKMSSAPQNSIPFERTHSDLHTTPQSKIIAISK